MGGLCNRVCAHGRVQQFDAGGGIQSTRYGWRKKLQEDGFDWRAGLDNNCNWLRSFHASRPGLALADYVASLLCGDHSLLLVAYVDVETGSQEPPRRL